MILFFEPSQILFCTEREERMSKSRRQKPYRKRYHNKVILLFTLLPHHPHFPSPSINPLHPSSPESRPCTHPIYINCGFPSTHVTQLSTKNLARIDFCPFPAFSGSGSSRKSSIIAQIPMLCSHAWALSGRILPLSSCSFGYADRENGHMRQGYQVCQL